MISEIFKAKADSNLPLPIYLSCIQAGFPSSAENDLEKMLDLNELLVAHPAATFFVRVKGDSMKNAGIFSGDVLVVDRSLEPTDNKIIVAVVGNEFTVKRLKISQGKISLLPENPAYPILEVKEGSDFQVWGVVTYVIHKAI
jgi:DNA polymerase V